MTPGIADLKLKQLTLGGEIADQSILDSLREVFPEARIVHIYATTETGTVFAVDDGKAGFPDHFLTEGFRGRGLGISDDGTLLVSADSGSVIDTGDLVEVRDGRATFCGRLGGTINVGGVKVAPERVEEALRNTGWVVSASARGQRSPILGYTVAAEVVLVPGLEPSDELARELRRACRAALPREAIPSSVSFVEGLTIDPSGKQSRRLAD